jgi:uncharacterized protein with PQ loop repeat
MHNLLSTIGGACVVLALFLDSLSYWKQIAKTLRTKKSAHVSSSQYIYKIGKAVFALFGLAIYSNWVGVGIETFMVGVYIWSLYVVARHKPKGWKLFDPKCQKNVHTFLTKSDKKYGEMYKRLSRWKEW